MPKRSLMLAGGGVKVAFQAGVLQVWLDEAGIQFDHADAVSAACFNLAMWAQGMSGTVIAENWRNLHPLATLDVNWSQLPRLFTAESLLRLDAFRTDVFPSWGLSWDKIRTGDREATFNVYNFSKHELMPVTAPQMSEDYLIACASLSLWFPPVRIGDDVFIDAVFNTATNIDEAIRRGADEIWVIWTTSQRGEWFGGFVGNFFGIFEACTNHAYKQMLARIERNNAEIESGSSSEFGRQILVRELKAEVPVHYLLNLSRDRSAEAVNRGIEAARQWCDQNGFGSRAGVSPTARPVRKCKMAFRETAGGYVGIGATDENAGYEQGRSQGTSIRVQFDVRIEDVEEFIAQPEHQANLAGEVHCEVFGGKLIIQDGRCNLLVDDGDPTRKTVEYRMTLVGGREPYSMFAVKQIHDDPGHEAVTDLATLFIRIEPATESADGERAGKGVVRAGAIDFLKHLASFHVEAPSYAERISTLDRFGAFYLGHLWDVYARRVLPNSPV